MNKTKQDNVPQVKSVEDFAANENEKKSIRNFYEGWKAVHIHNEGLSTLCKVCPPEQYGEDEDCEELQNIIREMYYRIAELEGQLNNIQPEFDAIEMKVIRLEEENAKLREALEGILNTHSKVTSFGSSAAYRESYMLAEQALKGKEVKGE